MVQMVLFLAFAADFGQKCRLGTSCLQKSDFSLSHFLFYLTVYAGSCIHEVPHVK